MTTEYKALLTQDLKRFGLNPQDWSLQHTDDLDFQIRHQDDTDFILHGQCVSVFSAQWKFITLESL